MYSRRAAPLGSSLPWLAALASLAAAPALAQEHPAQELNDQVHTLSPDEPEKTKTKPDLLIVPIPMSNPSTGAGLTIAAVLFYNPNHAPQPWITGAGASYTETGTKAIAAFHSMSLDHDRFRFIAAAGYADAKLKFYGVGPEAGARNVSVDIEDKGILFLAQGQMRVFPHGYAGARFEYLHIDSSVDIPHPNYPDLALPPLEAKSTLVTIGPSLTYDSRDSSLNPRKGSYATATWMLGIKAFGGDFDHDKLQVAGNTYLPLGRNTVVAGRVAFCGASREVPFYDLCMFGQNSDLRGYETGRYRDRASWAVQGEVRQHLFWRVGVVAFAGIGGVAPDLGSIIDDSTVLPAAGVGLRFQASKKNNVNLRLDFAVGKDSQALYFSIGEAF